MSLNCNYGFEQIENPYAAYSMKIQLLDMSSVRLICTFLSLSHFRIESKYEVTILGGLNEFAVKFYGPRGSTGLLQNYM